MEHVNKPGPGTIAACLAAILLVFALPASPEMRPVPKLRPGFPPQAILERIMRGNAAYVEGKPETAPPRREVPVYIWLADPTPRLWARSVLGQDAAPYLVRSLAFRLAPVTAEVDYGVRNLFLPLLLITADTGNQPLGALLSRTGLLTAEARKALESLELATTLSNKEFRKRSKTGQLRLLVQEVLQRQVEQAVRRYADRIKNGRLVVVGGVIDTENIYKRGKNRLFITSINGITERKKLLRSPHLRQVPPKLRVYIGPPQPGPDKDKK